MSTAPDCIVIGSGVIGCATALQLQREGQSVLLLDTDRPGAGASFGNAGMVGRNAVVPMASPRFWRQLPALLFGRRRSVIVRPHALPAALRWLRLSLKMANEPQLLRSRDGLDALHHQALEDWLELLGEEAWTRLFRPGSSVSRHESTSAEAVMASLAIRLRAQVNVPTQTLGDAQISRIFPELDADGSIFTHVERTAAIRDPLQLLTTLRDRFIAEGGRWQRFRAERFALDGGRISGVTGDGGRLSANHYVLAAGHASSALLPACDLHIPLIAERGYHIMLERSRPLFNDSLQDGLMPCVLHDASHKCVITEMCGGIRVSGFAEYADPGSPARRDCYDRLEHYFRQRFPRYPRVRLSQWYGHRPSTPDSLPYIDRHPTAANLICAFGHGHYGMSGAPATARRVSDLISNRDDSANRSPFSLHRFTD